MVVFFSIFRPHLNSARATFQVKRVNLYLWNMYDRYIYIYENSTVVLASVGLAQARPNNRLHIIAPFNNKQYSNHSLNVTKYTSLMWVRKDNSMWDTHVVVTWHRRGVLSYPT